MTCESKKRICVMGMHRCGTSFITSELESLGVSLGEPSGLMAADQNNQKGYFENQAMTELADEILERFGGNHIRPPRLLKNWEQDAALDALRARAEQLCRDLCFDQKIWAWKDPRNSLLLPFWRQIVNPTHYIIAYRNPLEVARSMLPRDGITFQHSSALWLYHLASAIYHTQGCNRLFLDFSTIRDNPITCRQTLAGYLQLNTFTSAYEEDSNFEGKLVHNQNGIEELLATRDVIPLSKLLYLEMESFSGKLNDDGRISPLIQLVENQYWDLLVSPFLSPCMSAPEFYQSLALNGMIVKNATIEAVQMASVEYSHLLAQQEELYGIKRSLSWRMTKPLRSIKNALR